MLQDTEEVDSECSNPTFHGKLLHKLCSSTELLDIGDGRIAPAEDEFDCCDLDDDIDPALKEEIDR